MQIKAPSALIQLVSIAGVTVTLGCASSPETRMGSEPDLSAASTADSAAFGADHFTFSKKQRVRPPNDFQFYFKNCVLNDQRSYYSRTSYWCEDF